VDPSTRVAERRAVGHHRVVRIVSLLPSATEIVYALGLEEDLVGVTHECDWPPEARQKPHVSFSKLPLGASPRRSTGS
jgi:iron complex transport system substrate-binding protein